MLIQEADAQRGCMAGEVVVITGGGRGIGQMTAFALAYLGASVAIAEMSETGRQTQDAIREKGGSVLWVKTDISEPDEWARFHDRVVAEWGRVDILVNNAEAVYPKAITEHSLEEWERVFAVNCRGVFLGIKHVLPGMLERHHGVIVFMPSAQGIPYIGPYSASKAAQESLSSSLAQEVGAEAGVSVITFGVGMVDTPATREYVPTLASRYGMSEAAFIAMAAPGGRMTSAELVATGLAGVILHAADLHGEQVDWPTGLARIGLRADGLPVISSPPSAAPAPPHTAGPQAAAVSTKDIDGLAVGVVGVVEEIRREYEDLGVFQKQWYRRTIRRRTGMDLDGWDRAAGSALAALREGGTGRIDPEYVQQLHRLADHLDRSEADWRGYVTDPAKRQSGIEVLERRRTVVLALARDLSEAARS